MTGVRYRGGGIWYANGHKYELSRYYWGKHQQFHLQLQQIINAKNKTQKSIDALQNAQNMVKNELKRKIERLKNRERT